MAINNTQSWFAKKAQLPATIGNPVYAGELQGGGILNPDGSTSTMDSRRLRAERAAVNGKAGASSTIRLGPGEIMPERAGPGYKPDFTVRGSVPPGQQVSTMTRGSHGYSSAILADQRESAWNAKMTGPNGYRTEPLTSAETKAFESSPDGRATSKIVPPKATTTAPEGMFQRVGPDPNATSQGAQRTFAERAGRAVGQRYESALSAAKGSALPAVLGAAGVALEGAAMDSDGKRSAFYDSPDVSLWDKAHQGVRDVAQLALPAAGGIVGGTAGSVLGPVGTLGGGVAGAGAGHYASHLVQGGLNLASRALGGSGKAPIDEFDYSPKTPVPQVITPDAEVAQPRPFTVAATPEAEAKRQIENTTPTQFGGNGLLAKAEAGLSQLRGRYAQGGDGGIKAFRDPSVQAAFNARNMLEGTGIAVNTTKDGRLEFSGDNRAGGGQLYRAADGSMTTDWSKTQQYADAIQRNAADQNRLVELTRGAALAGDKEALARLTKGDARLEGIAKEASTEKSLRDAARNGSVNAMHLLTEMEKTKADGAYKAADLGLRRAALAGAQEDRDLNRQLRADQLRLSLDNDARDFQQARVGELDKQLEQYATVDGKLDGSKLSRLRGLAANLKPSQGQSPEEFNKDVSTLVGLASKLDNMQAFYDRWTSQAGLGGTDLRVWKPNSGLRGGFITDQGDHMSTSQYNSLTDDEKVAFKKYHLKGGK